MGAPVLLKNAVDSFVSELYPSKNYSTVDRLYLADASAADTRYTYMYFGVPSGMAKTTILSATLRVYSGWSGWAGSVTMSVYRLASKFSATGVTWNNKPAATGSAVSLTKTSAASGTSWSFDVTSIMQQVADGSPWYGFRIQATNSTAKWLHSAQAVSFVRPQLEITWSDAPDAPETLIPTNSEVVSLAKPTLRWDFTDPSGDTTMDSFNLRLFSTLANANANTPTILDTTLASDVPQLDLNTTAYAGLADGSTVWWRVRVKDGAGLWSGWSAVGSFRRVSKGTLTINNPAAPANNFVTDPTPPFSWTFSGRTQKAYEVLLSTPDAPAVYLWRSGAITSTAVAATPPPNVITQNGFTYRLTIRIYDTEDRRWTPGDPPYVEATRDFTFNLSATVATVTSFTGVPTQFAPYMLLQWNRTTAPDTFVIYRDGKVVGEYQPSELWVSGTQYQYKDASAPPRVNHTWSVAAKSGGVTSSSNPTYTNMIRLVTTAIYDPDSGKTVFFFNPGVDARRGEESTIHVLAGTALPPVMITQSQRGYEGSVQGVLVNDIVPGLTASQQLDNLGYFRRHPGLKLKMIWVDKALNVVVRGVTDAPIPHPDGTVEHMASLEFFEIDF